jgi:thiamine biosynthesis lipoprotein
MRYLIGRQLFQLSLLFVLGVIFLPSLMAQQRHVHTHPAMGTEFRITISTVDTNGMAAAVRQSFARVDALEQRMSDYRADSELNQLGGSTKWQPVSPDLYKVLRFSRELAKRSEGAFDPTIGPLSKLWRRAFRQQEFPDQEDILAARARVRWKDLKTSRVGQVRLRRKNRQLDLGGVAKGYALDVVGAMLRDAGFPAFLVDGGGDLLLGEAPVGQAGWTVLNSAMIDLSVKWCNIAIVTSGDTYQYLDSKGVRYSHIIDPRTGLGTVNEWEVTVIGPVAMVADGLASTVCVAGNTVLSYYPEYDFIRLAH